MIHVSFEEYKSKLNIKNIIPAIVSIQFKVYYARRVLISLKKDEINDQILAFIYP